MLLDRLELVDEFHACMDDCLTIAKSSVQFRQGVIVESLIGEVLTQGILQLLREAGAKVRLPFPILCARVVHLDPEALLSLDKDFNKTGQPITTVDILIQIDVASPKMKRSKRNPAEKQIAKSKNNN